MFKPHEFGAVAENTIGKIEVELRVLGLQAKEQLSRLAEVAAAPFVYAIGKIGEKGAEVLKQSRLGLPIGLAGVLAPGIDSINSLFQQDELIANALASQNKPAEVWTADAKTLAEMGYAEDFPGRVVGDRLYVGDNDTNKAESYFLLDQQIDNDVVSPDTGVAPLWGLKDVNKVVEYVPGMDPAVDAIIANAHTKAIAEGYYFSPDGVTALKIVDTKLQPVVSLVKGARRGGMEVKTVDDTYLVFAKVAGTGQAVVVLGKDAQGVLTGFEGGNSDGKMFALVFGSGDMADVLGVNLTLEDGNQIFQPLIDTKTGEALIPTGNVVTQNVNENGVMRKRARIAAVENYVSPDYLALQDVVAASENYTLNNGLIENNGTPVGGVRVDRNGVVWLTVNGGEEIQIDKTLLNFEDDELVVDGYSKSNEGVWEMVVKEIVEYPMCSSVEYDKCVIQNVEELFDGSYMRWFETKSQPFTAEQVDKRPWYIDGFGLIYPDAWEPRVPGTVTAHLNITYAVFEMDGVEYKLVPFELPDPSDPTNVDKNIRVLGFQLANEIKDNVIGKKYPQGAFDRFSEYWATKVTVPPILTDFRYPMSSAEIPLAKMTWDKIGPEKMAEIFKRVQDGDVAALRELNGYPVMLINQFSDNYTK